MNALSILNKKIVMPDGHFRSKFFVATNSLNSYVAAAGPIFSILERLNTATCIESFDKIYETISHEIKAFLSNMHAKEPQPEHDTIAYFLICATTDEILGKCSIKFKVGNKKSFRAFTPIGKNNISPQETFFEIISYIKQSPENFLNLLELAYFCLILGYEGIYHNDLNARQHLDSLIEELYQLIKTHRIHEPINFFREYQPKMYNHKHKYRYFIKFTLLAIFIAIGVYLCDHFLLSSSVAAIKTEHQYTLALED
jgi:type VI secretion system protein ImpK